MTTLKTTKHKYHAPYTQPMYVAEYKGKKFKIQKRELPSTEWDLLEYLPDHDEPGAHDYEDYCWCYTYPSKKMCVEGVVNFVDYNVAWR